MELKLNDILNLSKEEIDNCRIEMNMTAGSGAENFLDKWLKYSDDKKKKGQCTECSYWGWYGSKQRNFYPGNIVFSFIRVPHINDAWLLISAAEILEVPKGRAKVRVLEKYEGLYGRLIIKCKKGNTFSRYVFKLEKYLDQCIVNEILPSLYSGDEFQGYDNVHLPYDKLEDIFEGKIMHTYYEALRKITGVYCLTDTKTGRLYIGSATGDGGVAQRWGNYLNSKHGGNKDLIELYKNKGPDYFKKYFTFTLVEYFGLSYDPEKVKEREQYWKKCFDTIKHGYNEN